MFRAQGEVVTLGGEETYALVDITDEDGAQGYGPRALVRKLSVTLATDSLAGLAVGSVLGVRSQSWRVRELQLIEDGAITSLLCATS